MFVYPPFGATCLFVSQDSHSPAPSRNHCLPVYHSREEGHCRWHLVAVCLARYSEFNLRQPLGIAPLHRGLHLCALRQQHCNGEPLPSRGICIFYSTHCASRWRYGSCISCGYFIFIDKTKGANPLATGSTSTTLSRSSMRRRARVMKYLSIFLSRFGTDGPPF